MCVGVGHTKRHHDVVGLEAHDDGAFTMLRQAVLACVKGIPEDCVCLGIVIRDTIEDAEHCMGRCRQSL